MQSQGWKAAGALHHAEPEGGFYVWREETAGEGKSHMLWVAEEMVHRLGPAELVGVLKQERVAEDLKISFRLRIEERGTEYRVSLVPRRSGEFRALE